MSIESANTVFAKIPSPGLGTYRLQGEVAYESVQRALTLGYRHIDTAQFYENETAVGRAIADSGVARDEVFLVTKIWHDRLGPGDLEKSVLESLTRLGTDYVDLLLIHWPAPHGGPPMEGYLSELASCRQSGQARHLGVSNFTCEQLTGALQVLGADNVLTNQIEVHPFLQNRVLVEHCQSLNVGVTAYMPLAVGAVNEDATLERIAATHGATAAQVTLAWLKELGILAIPSSKSAEHLEANLKAADIALTEADMQDIAALDCGRRLANPSFAPQWDQQ